MAASLDHPNVIPIYEAGESEGLLCIAMRYVEGTDLKRLLRAEGGLEPAQALALLRAGGGGARRRPRARASSTATSSPRTSSSPRAATATWPTSGSPSDAADRSDLTLTGQSSARSTTPRPSRSRASTVDGRADVYSLGCLLYECLTGSVPFPKDSDLAVLWAHVNEPPPGLDAYPPSTGGEAGARQAPGRPLPDLQRTRRCRPGRAPQGRADRHAAAATY